MIVEAPAVFVWPAHCGFAEASLHGPSEVSILPLDEISHKAEGLADNKICTSNQNIARLPTDAKQKSTRSKEGSESTMAMVRALSLSLSLSMRCRATH
jgi:hypothetical protein